MSEPIFFFFRITLTLIKKVRFYNVTYYNMLTALLRGSTDDVDIHNVPGHIKTDVAVQEQLDLVCRNLKTFRFILSFERFLQF